MWRKVVSILKSPCGRMERESPSGKDILITNLSSSILQTPAHIVVM